MSDQGKRILTLLKKKDVSKKMTEWLYKKEAIQNEEAEFLYSIALILIHEYEDHKDKVYYIQYAYEIIARTSFKIKQFKALYDFSVNYGYYPVARKITQLNLINEPTINYLFSEIAIDDFEDKNKILTFEQKRMFDAVLKDETNDESFLAPTSYGKSQLIFEHIQKHSADIIGIIIPTKALIDQFNRDAKKIITGRKIIIHDQNYNSTDTKLLAIVTQERALRLIEQGVKFDRLYIDEAHELLDFNFGAKRSNRSLLLARLINLAKKNNEYLKILYLSPVLNASDSLKLQNGSAIAEHKIENDLKIMDIHFLDNDMKEFQYDRYLGEFIELKTVSSQIAYIQNNSKNKNLHFLYRPIYIEDYAEKLYQKLDECEIPESIQKLIKELKFIVHDDFKLVRYLEKGIIYLHAKLPAEIKNYLMKFVREESFIKHFVANSVVLAGMNLPVDNLFYISGFSKLRDMYNLIGRVNRLNEIFSEDNQELSRMLIPIHFIDMKNFPQSHNVDLKKKVEKLRSKFQDDIKNPLLENAKIEDNNKPEAEKIKNSEQAIVDNFSNPEFKEKITIAGAQQILNYSSVGLGKLKQRISRTRPLENIDLMFDMIKQLFFDGFEYGNQEDARDYTPEYNALRLRNEETIKYYKMFLSDMKRFSLKERIDKTVSYWSQQEETYKIYVGSSFGEVEWNTENYTSGRKVYVELSQHINEKTYLNNLAVVKLQTDEDFLGHEISLLINTLLVFEIITQDQYNEFYYGTKIDKELQILQLGISRTIFNQLKKDNQVKNIEFDQFGNAKANKVLKDYITVQNGLYKFELEQYFN